MEKPKIILVISGVLIVIGLILSVVGNQVILEGFSQGNGKISLDQALIVSGDFDAQESPIGIFAVQVMEFRDNTFSIRVLDPFDTEIISQGMNEDKIENEFNILETGTYKLIIENMSSEEIQVFGAIGPSPDAGKKSLEVISGSVLVVGMIGLAASAVYAIKNRNRSI